MKGAGRYSLHIGVSASERNGNEVFLFPFIVIEKWITAGARLSIFRSWTLTIQKN